MATPERVPDFDDMIAGVGVQARTFAVDFTTLLPTGVTLQGTPVITVTCIIGTDPTPQNILDASSVTIVAGVGGAAKALSFRLLNLLPARYLLVYSVPASNGDRVPAFNHVRGISPS